MKSNIKSFTPGASYETPRSLVTETGSASVICQSEGVAGSFQEEIWVQE